MLIGYIPGVWDLLHVGHVSALTTAKSFVETLIVGVPTDTIVQEDKGIIPIISVEDRVKMLQSLRAVDVAAVYYELDFLPHLRMFKPDILFVGEDWGALQRHQDAEYWVVEHKKRLVRIPRYRAESTTKIKERICHES